MGKYRSFAFALAVTTLAMAAPAYAETLRFTATLTGSGAVETGSAATATMTMVVDTDSKRVSLDMSVEDMPVDALSDTLIAKPIGPVHFHQYGSHEHHNAASVLVLPLPYGAGYQATATGFTVTLKDYDYAAGSQLAGGTIGFDEFIAALKTGRVILNVHTDKFPDGEISGTVTAA